MNLKLCSVSLLALTAIAGAAAAQDNSITWTGPYAGVNLGGAWSTTCATWTPTVPGVATVFTGSGCPNNASFIGGVQAGYNFQSGGWVGGIEADVNGGTSVSTNVSRTTAGNEFIPGGTYTASGWHTPGAVETVRMRVGYAFDRALIYFTGGGAFAGGSSGGTITYTPTGANVPAASFSGGNNGTRTGWTVGGGVEYKLTQKWSIKAEDLYMNLGNLGAPHSCVDLNGSVACGDFGGVNFISQNHAVNLNIFRVGVNYAF